MRRNQIWRNVVYVALGLGATALLGGYWYVQQQKVDDLQQQIDQLPNGKDKAALVKDRIALENTIAGTLIQGFGGFFFIVTAYVSFQSLKATQKNVSIAQENLRVSEEKQVTERFTQAINQLGSEKIEVRLGGIYALERIAKDSPKDHWTIMEVLTSFVQEKSPVEDSGQTEEQPLTKITKDVQAALTVIGRRDAQNDPKEAMKRIDLSRANLSEADLNGADLSGAKFYFASLYKANLSRANLSRAEFIGADLSGTIFRSADLHEADLNMSTFGKGFLGFTDFCEAKNLSPSQVQDAFNWEEAHYDKDFRQQLGLPPEQKS